MADDRDGARSADETQQFDPFADDVDEPEAPGGNDKPATRPATDEPATADEPAPADETALMDAAGSEASAPGDETVAMPAAAGGSDEREPASDETAPMAAARDSGRGAETAPMAAVSPDETAPMVAADETAPIPAGAGGWSGRAGVPPPDATAIRGPVPSDWEPVPGDERRWWMPILLGFIALLLLGVLVVGIWLIMRASDSGTGGETPAPSPSAVPTTAAAPTTPAPTSAPATTTSGPVSVEVPNVVGLTQADAQAQLDAAGLPYRLEFRQSDRPTGTVIDTDPAGGMTVPEGTQIVLVIAEPAPTSASPTAAATSSAAEPSPTS